MIKEDGAVRRNNAHSQNITQFFTNTIFQQLQAGQGMPMNKEQNQSGVPKKDNKHLAEEVRLLRLQLELLREEWGPAPWEGESDYRLLVESSPEWDYWLGTDGKLRYVSPTAEYVTGYKPAEWLANPQLLLETIHPEDRELAEPHLRHDHSAREGGGHMEYRIITRTGEERIIEHLCCPVITPDGEFMGRRVSNRPVAAERQVVAAPAAKPDTETTIALDAVLAAWASSVEFRECSPVGQNQRSIDLTLVLARSLGITDEEELVHLRRGALLHDIGKMVIPETLLMKTATLKEEEWTIIHQHPLAGYNMLCHIPFLRSSLDIVLYHHERWDGEGYPKGLKGEEIPLSARIFAVVDVWEALTSERPFRPPWSQKEALDYIHKESGTRFDPQVVKKFMSLLGVTVM
jgi:PAS domain S-box-containing protein